MSGLSRRAAVGVFALFAGAYFLSYALRSINAVIAPELIARFGLSNAQLGALSSAYFLSFALMQLPLGMALDRYGARRTNALLLLFSAAGCLVFATAQDTAALWAGRALIGVGVSGALMSALKGYRFWYPPEHQGRLAAWMLVVGTGGAMAVTVPVEMALPLLGWRGLFIVAAVALVVVSAGIVLGLPRDEERSLAPSGAEPVWAGFGQIYRRAEFWRWAIVSLSMQSHFVALQSLWAGPWFTQVLGMSPGEAAAALFVVVGGGRGRVAKTLVVNVVGVVSDGRVAAALVVVAVVGASHGRVAAASLVVVVVVASGGQVAAWSCVWSSV